MSLGKSRPVSTGVTRCGGSATPLSPPPPAPFPAVAAARSVADSPRASSGSAHVRSALRRISVPAAAFRSRRSLGLGGVTTFGLGATTGVASLLMFFGAEPPSLSFGFGCCACWRWRRRRRNVAQVEHTHYALRIGQIDFPRQMEQGEQQQRVDRDYRRNRAALVAVVEVRPVHDRSTLTLSRTLPA